MSSVVAWPDWAAPFDAAAWRHYLGRAYATLASMALGISVYDTQCGAKVFRVNETFVDALVQPFPSQWTLDVELLHRLLGGGAAVPGLPATAFAELPLETWRDVGGSKLRLGSALRALVDLARIARSRRRHERAGHHWPRPVVETPVMAPPVGQDGHDPTRAPRSGRSDWTRHQA